MSKRELEFPLRGHDSICAAIKALLGLKLDATKPEFVCVIRPYEKNRSLAQNALFHKWVGEISDDTGGDREWVKNEIKRKFLGVERHAYKGEDGKTHYIETIKKTSDLKVKEMNTFMTAVQAWAATDMGITLTVPADLAWAMEDDAKK